MGTLILIIILNIVVFILGMKFGLSFIANSLLANRKITLSEYKYIGSWKYIKDLLSL